MEKKTLTKEQMEAIVAGTGLQPIFAPTILYPILLTGADVTSEAILKEAAAQKITITTKEAAILATNFAHIAR